MAGNHRLDGDFLTCSGDFFASDRMGNSLVGRNLQLKQTFRPWATLARALAADENLASAILSAVDRVVRRKPGRVAGAR
jgi:hypothetical protein